ncbi:UNVERIFIED_ORG: type I restriction enzyme S subunit [Leuconostoc holzapfelii]
MSKQTPQIRFKGFTDDWEERKLGDEVQIVMGQSPNSENYTDNPNNYILVQGNADMNNGHVFPRVWTTQVTKQAEKNDLILSVRAPVGNIGKTAYNVVIGRGVAAIKGNEFIFQSLGKMKSDGYWTRYSTGSTFESINSTDIKEAIINVPAVEEQSKIGSFFKVIDDTIALHQRKLDLLKEQKKGFLQKMFPKNGAKVPELRFAGFTDDWEERKLLDNVDKVLDYRGKSPTKFGMEWGTEGYLVLSALNVKNGYIDKSAEAKYGNQELFERWMGTNILEKGDVLFTTEAPLGNVAQVPDNNGYILNQRAVAFKSSKETDDNFFAQLLRSPIVQNILNANSSGGTAKGIGMKEFAKLYARVPKKIEEQSKIGSFFKQLDDTIALHQRKLNLLQEQKKGFLQKMFVQ